MVKNLVVLGLELSFISQVKMVVHSSFSRRTSLKSGVSLLHSNSEVIYAFIFNLQTISLSALNTIKDISSLQGFYLTKPKKDQALAVRVL